MRSRTPLALMEQLVMLLVFALAAALCVQVFVFADQTARRGEARDRAVLEAQNAAETMKRTGSMEPAWYDENWEIATEASAAYSLSAEYAESPHPALWSAEICVRTAEGDVLFTLPVTGRNGEVSGGA